MNKYIKQIIAAVPYLLADIAYSLYKLIADLFELPVWERGKDRVVTPPWHALTVDERDLIAQALQQWKPDPCYQLPYQPKTVS